MAAFAIFHVALVGAALRPLAARTATRTTHLQCAGTQVPVPFRPLSQQEIVDKLDAVPVFSVCNRDREMFPSRRADGELCCSFYTDIGLAQRKLAEVQATNPGMPLSLAVTPMGTAYALSEWAPPTLETPSTDTPVRQDLAESIRGAVRSATSGGVAVDRDGLQAEPKLPKRFVVELCIVACEDEVAAVKAILEQAPTPALTRKANRAKGPIPLFGSDELRFASGDGDAEEETLTPLFFRRSDFLAGWLASGGTDVSLPPAQVSDLRTLVWQMECESAFNWRSVQLVAPQESIDFAVSVEREREAAGRPAPTAPPVPMKRSQVQSGIFPADAGALNK